MLFKVFTHFRCVFYRNYQFSFIRPMLSVTFIIQAFRYVDPYLIFYVTPHVVSRFISFACKCGLYKHLYSVYFPMVLTCCVKNYDICM